MLEKLKQRFSSGIKSGDRVVWRGSRIVGEIEGIAYFGQAVRTFGYYWKVKYDSGSARTEPESNLHLAKVTTLPK